MQRCRHMRYIPGYAGIKPAPSGAETDLPLKESAMPDVSTRFKRTAGNATGNGADKLAPGFQPAIEGWRKLQGDIGMTGRPMVIKLKELDSITQE